MSLFEALNSQPRDRPPFHCRIYQTYLPPSYLPRSCAEYFQSHDGLYYYPQWAWSLINTVFVSTATVINFSIFTVGVFLWMANRQFHFSRKKHSYDKEPLRPLKPLKKAKKSSIKALKKARRNIINKVRKRGVQVVEEDDENVTAESDKEPVKEKPGDKSFSSFLEGVEEDDDIGPSILSKQPIKKDNTKSGRKGTKDLLQVASKIEVFSYLSPEAVIEILKYVEYVDLSSDPLGKVVFDNNTLDGSLYAVVSGEVTMTLSVHDINHHDNNRTKNDNHSFEFVAGSGEVVTSLLTLISSLIREYQIQENPGLAGSDFISLDMSGRPITPNDKSSLIPDGIDVQAVVSAPNTCLMRIPSKCFVDILGRFPKDVHQICQTIVARLQRVTIQSLVRFLGLDDQVLGTGSKGYHDTTALDAGKLPQRKPRKTAEWKQFEETLSNEPSVNVSLLDQAIPAAASLLGLPAEKCDLLKEGASIVSFPPGSVICKSGEAPGALYLILKGSVQVSYGKNGRAQATAPSIEKQPIAKRKENLKNSPRKAKKDSSEKSLFCAGSGTFVGLFSCFTGDSSFINVHNPESENSALLLQISSQTFENIVSTYPRALIHCLLDILDTIGSSPSVYLLDWTLDWMHVEAGEHIAVKGQPCDSIFVVLNGRLRTGFSSTSTSSDSRNASVSKCLEYGRGETIGGLEALAEERWTHDVFASRHCEVARVPMTLLNVLMSLYPAAGIHFAKVIAKMQTRKGISINKSLNATESLLPSYGLSLATIAVVPLTPDVDISKFCESLATSLRSIAPTKLLTKNETIKRIGKTLLARPSALTRMRTTRYLGDIEENNRLVVYQADHRFTWFTKLAIQQADSVLVVVDSNSAPDLSLVEECLSWAHSVKNIRIDLVVVQSQAPVKLGENASKEVNDWNENRSWISKQHLVRAPFKDHSQDFSRLTRRITGQSIGLVLGGGGARGLAHLGVIRALNEAGISVDMVGGTSQGAFVGALYAKNPDDIDELEKNVRAMADNMSSIKEKLLDLTFPITSFFNGSRFNNGIHKLLGDTRIQDLVLNFYCISVDIRNSCQVVHRKGITWKAVRASMSLAGYLPPMSEGSSLLVDGGYMNVIPADVMSESGAKKVIAVDVSYESVHDFYDYGADLSGWWLIWNSWNPFIKTVRVPSMGDINEMLSWISGEHFKRQNIENNIDLFLRPPVNDYGTLEYNKFNEIVQVGYDYAKPLIEQWADEHGYFNRRD